MRKKLIILEGPAGSGKSTTLQQFTARNPQVMALERRKETNGKRSYDTEFWPFMMELEYLLTAAYAPCDRFLVDRFWLNSLVYQPFRYTPPARYGPPEAFPTHHAVHVSLSRLVHTAYSIIHTAYLRDWNLPEIQDFHLSFHVLVPHKGMLDRNRGMSGKDYPFDEYTETVRYLRILEHWQDLDYGPVRTTMTRHLIQSPEDYTNVLGSLDLEVTH